VDDSTQIFAVTEIVPEFDDPLAKKEYETAHFNYRIGLRQTTQL